MTWYVGKKTTDSRALVDAELIECGYGLEVEGKEEAGVRGHSGRCV